jgi:hypothetical protein
VLLLYGYRHKPFGVRARVLDAECTNLTSAPEIVLRLMRLVGVPVRSYQRLLVVAPVRLTVTLPFCCAVPDAA